MRQNLRTPQKRVLREFKIQLLNLRSMTKNNCMAESYNLKFLPPQHDPPAATTAFHTYIHAYIA